MSVNKTSKYLRLWLFVTCTILALGRVEAFVNNRLNKIAIFPSFCTSRTKKTSLHLTPLTKITIASALGHVLGGVAGTPPVMKATKKGGWYRRISLPKWTPPALLFGPVWTTLYASMGVAFARIGYATGFLPPLVFLWAAHYLLNVSWTLVFFGAKRLRLALFINCAMLASLVVIIPWYWSINPLAGMLLLPYAAWLLFATVLNLAICRLNPTVNGYNDAKFYSDLLDLQAKAAVFANS